MLLLMLGEGTTSILEVMASLAAVTSRLLFPEKYLLKFVLLFGRVYCRCLLLVIALVVAV